MEPVPQPAAPPRAGATVRRRRAAPPASPVLSRGRALDEGEAAARRTLRAQITRLEAELAALTARATPRDGLAWSVPATLGGPRLLGLGELERIRDGLAERVRVARATVAARRAREARARALLERMLREPARYRFVRVTSADIGEPGCAVWASRPRLGLIGMLAGWWHVTVSSGCPRTT